MSKLTDLLDQFQSSSLVLELHNLKKKINTNPRYIEVFEEIKFLQKQMVQFEYYSKTSELSSKKRDYETHLNLLLSDPIVSEYLDKAEELNALLHQIQEIINNGLNEIQEEL
ncbi:MAG: YlbF family regulator [Firmicutes bacterium]|nr:YlbF family regulator [Bacillota bacterium]